MVSSSPVQLATTLLILSTPALLTITPCKAEIVPNPRFQAPNPRDNPRTSTFQAINHAIKICGEGVTDRFCKLPATVGPGVFARRAKRDIQIVAGDDE
ncbi:hypothetical protein HK102_007535, partial [Quaeritorhiza haematococci]